MRRAALPLLALLAGCGGSGTSPTLATPVSQAQAQSKPRAVLAVSVNASPLATTGDAGAPYLARWDVVIEETAGIGGEVNFVNTSIRDAANGGRATPSGSVTMNSALVAASAGTSHIAAHGTLTVPQSLRYALPSGGRAIALIVGVQLTDENGNVVSGAAQAEIQ